MTKSTNCSTEDSKPVCYEEKKNIFGKLTLGAWMDILLKGGFKAMMYYSAE